VEEAGFEEGLLHCVDCLEFVLGCVSSTTSYLRLFALSLAHQQLT
jgi:vacuolar-type H+-ATPase subunit I/STV1